VIELSIAQVAAAVDGVARGEATVTAVQTDSREPVAGALFVALRGEAHDGHDHVRAAAAGGAVAALVEDAAALGDLPGVVVADTWRAIGALGGAVRRRVDPTVVAVTGSVGKTTTKDLARAALAADRRTVAAQGSFNNELGVPLTLLATRADTEALVVEVGARGIGHVAALMPLVAPDVGVVTAVAGAHLELFGDLDGVARAKGELVEALPGDGTAVLAWDDPRVAAMASRTHAHVLRVGRDGDVRARDVALDDLARVRASVSTPWGGAELVVPVPGRHNLTNALLALGAACAAGVAPEVAARGLAGARVSRWRAEVTTRADGVVVCNDAYNANPTAVLAALLLLDDLRRPGGRTVAVLGHMAELGAGEADGHREVGEAAGAGCDVVVGVGDVAPLVQAAHGQRADVHAVDTPDQAADLLSGLLRPDDAVLVKASRSAGLEAVAAALLDQEHPT